VLVVRDFVDSNREIFVVIFLLLSGRIRQHRHVLGGHAARRWYPGRDVLLHAEGDVYLDPFRFRGTTA
jgi:hypothetical protein